MRFITVYRKNMLMEYKIKVLRSVGNHKIEQSVKWAIKGGTGTRTPREVNKGSLETQDEGTDM